MRKKERKKETNEWEKEVMFVCFLFDFMSYELFLGYLMPKPFLYK